MKKSYAGTQILEDMSFAHNYNKFIKKGEYILILETEDTTHEKKLIINESN